MPLAGALTSVREMVATGVPFEHIEAFIESREMDDEQRALLWLVAWCGFEPSVVAAELGRARLASVIGVGG